MSSQFDRHATTYDEDLNQALSISGESKRFFAERRVMFLARSLKKLGGAPHTAIDYGCGTGDTVPLLEHFLGVKSVIGLDISAKSLEVAKISHNRPSYKFLELRNYSPDGKADLVYTNGVFHHIAQQDRGSAIDYIHRCLRVGGIFALWENNPLNPGTRYVMSQCSFDHQAMPMRAGSAKALVAARFEILAVNYLFFFPRFLRLFRPVESYLASVPLGAQYQILCRKV